MLKKVLLVSLLMTGLIVSMAALNIFVIKPLAMNARGIMSNATGTNEELDTADYVKNIVYLDKNYELIRAYKNTETGDKYIEYMFYSTAMGWAREQSKIMTLKLDDKLKSINEYIILTESELKELLVSLI